MSKDIKPVILDCVSELQRESKSLDIESKSWLNIHGGALFLSKVFIAFISCFKGISELKKKKMVRTPALGSFHFCLQRKYI